MRLLLGIRWQAEHTECRAHAEVRVPLRRAPGHGWSGPMTYLVSARWLGPVAEDLAAVLWPLCSPSPDEVPLALTDLTRVALIVGDALRELVNSHLRTLHSAPEATDLRCRRLGNVTRPGCRRPCHRP